MQKELTKQNIVEELSLKKLDWYRAAADLVRIRDGNLWRDGSCSSWSCWIRQLGKRTNRHPEGLFKMISAFTYFCDLRKVAKITDPDRCTLSMDNLILIRAISSGNMDLASRFYNDVVAKRYGRKQLKIIKQHVANVWEPDEIEKAVKRGEIACLLEKSRIFDRNARFIGKIKVRTTVFDAVFISASPKDQTTVIHGIKILLPGSPALIDPGEYGMFVHAFWLVTEGQEPQGDGSGWIICETESEVGKVQRHPELGRAMKKNELLLKALERR